jgi:hypothetical protein
VLRQILHNRIARVRRSKLEAPKHLARNVHHLCIELKYEDFRQRTIRSLSNAFASAFKELDPIPQFKATAKLGNFFGNPFFPLVLVEGWYRPTAPSHQCLRGSLRSLGKLWPPNRGFLGSPGTTPHLSPTTGWGRRTVTLFSFAACALFGFLADGMCRGVGKEDHEREPQHKQNNLKKLFSCEYVSPRG